MDALANPATKSATTLKSQIFASELLTTLEQLGNQIKVLSLDCFDTMIWRKTTSPLDAFYDMHQQPLFNSLNLSAPLRSSIETDARRDMVFQQGKAEVTLNDIYRAGFPSLEKDQLAQLTKEELACYARMLLRKEHWL